MSKFDGASPHPIESRPQELRYRIADAINDGLKRLPGVHAALKRIALKREQNQLRGGARRARMKTRESQGYKQLPFGLNIAGYIASEKGLGEAMRSTVRSLSAVDVPYVVNNFTERSSANIERVSVVFAEDNPYRVNLLHFNADYVPAFARSRQSYFAGRLNVGYWNWELAEFPAEWEHSFDYFDQVWVPTNFVKASVEKKSPVPVACIPYSINLETLDPPRLERREFGLPEDAFVFFFMFDFHSTMQRKNPVGLVKAFRQAFGDRKDVRLLFKTAHSDGSTHLRRQLDEVIAGASNIQILDRLLPREKLQGLMAMSDCYASLHRSEGFGLTLTEAMSLGKPVIATAYSGNMDFTTPQNSFLVDYQLVDVGGNFGPYSKGVWADPDLDQAAAHMRFVVEERDATRKIAERGRQEILAQLHPKTVGTALRKQLEALSV